jgi:multidrug efflux pump subunit AcrB
VNALAAIREAAPIRCRPIMTTTRAALLGASPIARASAPAQSCAGRSA